MIYLDSSALLKLVHEEGESDALEQWLSVRGGAPVVSSELARLEVIRACRRVDAEALPEARALLAGIDLIPITGSIIDEAADMSGITLRSLDAIHLASAVSIGAALAFFVTYDSRLDAAASAVGLSTDQPGAHAI